ncbi:tyrosine recombinase XerC [Parasphingorhabdus halotolerans]|uniref:Tyrosine recombinase XerC n=1 Tax=Parasphingorhabdus halotolerans TaxID=2725558 RepID=A0A6H2DJW8_9SPHN|nr:tyrosine recombinase XerC [Parasphingorhabdus halotolerans]QJB68972.1 tyrosine recombinase XerC [Parasphingorhabdus halotolerans]
MVSTNAIIEGFSAYLRDGRRRSDHTVRAYVTTAERFCGFLMEHLGGNVGAAEIKALKQADFRSYLAYRRADGLTNNSAARELSALRAFLKHVGGDETQIPKIKGPKVTRGVPRPASPDDIIALAQDTQDSASEDWIGARDWAVLLLLYGSGLRISEALDLTGDALPLSDVLRVTGKRGKTRIVPLLPKVRVAIEHYIDLCPHVMEPEKAIFRGKRGGPLSPNLIRRVVQQARTKLGISDKTTPHALRHSFATHLLAGGADLRSLQELLGHASLSSTQVYTAVDAAHLLDVYNNAHPRAG